MPYLLHFTFGHQRLEGRAIFHLMALISMSKAIIYTGKTLIQMLLSTSNAPCPLECKSTSSPSLRNSVGNTIFFPHGEILITKPLLRLRLTRFIQPSSLNSIGIHHAMFRIFNLLRINHESRDIRIMMEHCGTTLFFNQTRCPITNLLILALEFTTNIDEHIEIWVYLREYSFTLTPLEKGS